MCLLHPPRLTTDPAIDTMHTPRHILHSQTTLPRTKTPHPREPAAVHPNTLYNSKPLLGSTTAADVDPALQKRIHEYFPHVHDHLEAPLPFTRAQAQQKSVASGDHHAVPVTPCPPPNRQRLPDRPTADNPHPQSQTPRPSNALLILWNSGPLRRNAQQHGE